MRSSIITDVLQSAVFILFLGIVLFYVLPSHGASALLSNGAFRMNAGVDLLLVALLQVLSYPFHDPVLTDRGFISQETPMLKAFVWSGAIGFICIFAFSLVGVHARLEGIAHSDNVPAAVAQGFGIAAAFVMTVVMIVAGGSTVDSTFASLSKLVAQELPILRGRIPNANAVRIGAWTMVVFAVIGNLPMIAGTDILKATTVSGTMVMGLAPVFLMAGFTRYSPLSFHLSFWTGIVLGVLFTLGLIPGSWAIGDGKYALLLGTNLYGLILCFGGFLLPLWLGKHEAAPA